MNRPPPTLFLDEGCDRIVAHLTRRLAHDARWRRRSDCGHDLLVPLLRPDFIEHVPPIADPVTPTTPMR